MNKLKIISATIALLGSAVTGNAIAQSGDYNYPSNNINPSWYLLPSVNVTNPDDKFGNTHNGEGVGLRFGKAVSPMWDIQFGPTYTRARHAGLRYQQNTLGVDGLYMFTRERFRPFVLIGAGIEYDKVNSPTLRADDSSGYVNAGVGFQYAFDNRWGMQVDARRAHSYLRGNDFKFDRANTNILTIGLTYAFDAPRASTPIVRVAQTSAPEAYAPPPANVIAPLAPTVAPTPPPPPARFERYTLSSTELFAFDSSVLRMPQPKLDETADLMSRNAQVNNVTITGYTDRLGTDKYNMALSQRRADSVKSFLTNKGINPNRLNAIGKGESNPVVVCNDKKRVDLINCLEPNRRVEVDQITVERRVQ